MAKVVWRHAALDYLERIIRYVDQFDPAAAIRIGGRLLDLGDSLVTFSRRGRPVDRGVREMTTVPPYILVYEAHGDDVSILSIRHGARATD